MTKKRTINNPDFIERIHLFCVKRLSEYFIDPELKNLQNYLIKLCCTYQESSNQAGEIDWKRIALHSDISIEKIERAKEPLSYILDAIYRNTQKRLKIHGPLLAPRKYKIKHFKYSFCTKNLREPTANVWEDPDYFQAALDLHITRHRETTQQLRDAIIRPSENFKKSTLDAWRKGTRYPRSVKGDEVLRRIEIRYSLPRGYFRLKTPPNIKLERFNDIDEISITQRERMKWFLPDDFYYKNKSEQKEIIDWVNNNLLSGTTDYRKFQQAVTQYPFGLKFSETSKYLDRLGTNDPSSKAWSDSRKISNSNLEVVSPAKIAIEVDDLIRFKTSLLTPMNFKRGDAWKKATAIMRLHHIGLFLGALSADQTGFIKGLGVPIHKLSLGMLVFPAVWDWYAEWKFQRRGFYCSSEIFAYCFIDHLASPEYGWLIQNPHLAERLFPIPGLVSSNDIQNVRGDWDSACRKLMVHSKQRIKDLRKVVKIHRDKFEAILPILNADSPVGEYRKITLEIHKSLKSLDISSLDFSEALRSFLMLRIGLHSGLRPRNIRQLLFCSKEGDHRSDDKLSKLGRGELRWNKMSSMWEIFMPVSAFKNSKSSFFSNKPYRLELPDFDDLYFYIERYININRAMLLRISPDPQTFLVRTMHENRGSAEYTEASFYNAWRLAVVRYGIYNPYTGRGAIEGLLPHGPHNIRDILVTHILKKTGCFQQASYAIQDTPETVEKYYARFLPRDKVRLAANILNVAWV
jgi:hypothetical protein